MFIHKDFMLHNECAKKLYHEVAEKLPVFDYHCHLNTRQIAEDYMFRDITELWLGGDHYKWRAMRAMGIDEKYITGNASSKEKFKAWAKTLENCVANPLYHWSHLELKNYFYIDKLLTSENWEEIYDACNKVLREEKLTARKLIENSNVEFICTTDAPADSLEYHKQIFEDKSFKVKVVPGFRPDEALNVERSEFKNFIIKLSQRTGMTINNYNDFISSLEDRIKFFKSLGSMVSDHGLNSVPFETATLEEIEIIFNKALSGEKISNKEADKFRTQLLVDLGKIYKANDFIMQIHFGAIRNNNSKMYKLLGADTGFDSISTQTDLAYNINHLLDALNNVDALPKVILYNLNPIDNSVLGTAMANFQTEAGIRGKIQFGSGWWFNDTKEGMIRQFSTLAEQGLIMNFVGMLTDSRSFISYTRHEYFRRIFCNYIGELVEKGEIPNIESLLTKLVKNVAHDNAVEYFELK